MSPGRLADRRNLGICQKNTALHFAQKSGDSFKPPLIQMDLDHLDPAQRDTGNVTWPLAILGRSHRVGSEISIARRLKADEDSAAFGHFCQGRGLQWRPHHGDPE